MLCDSINSLYGAIPETYKDPNGLINMGEGKYLLLVGLTFAIFSAFTVPVNAETLCSYAGPDLSDDLLRLTNFSVIGPATLKEGDAITVKFDLQNFGQYDLNLGSKGVFVAARDPDAQDASFGFTRANTTLKIGETVSVETSKILNRDGNWLVWPSYHLSLATGEKFGPENWHGCSLVVLASVQDSDQDGISDEDDNCPQKYNPEQADDDGDGIGNACDSCDDRDSDEDGIKNCLDACPNEPETYNGYEDEDGCPDEAPLVDTAPPVVSVHHSPASPTFVSNITFNVIVTDDTNVTKVVIYVNGRASFKCEPPEYFWKDDYWQCTWYAGRFPAGVLTYRAEAFDSAGHKGVSDEKNMNVTGFGSEILDEIYEGFSFVTEGPIMQEALGDGDGDGVLNFEDMCPDTPERLKEYVYEDGCICHDSDGGDNPFERGVITYRDALGGEHTYEDHCGTISTDLLVEYYCNPDELGAIQGDDYVVRRSDRSIPYCPRNHKCVQGRCVPLPSATPTICFSREPVTNRLRGTCHDGIQNQDEEGVDCGGRCPPCNTKCTTGTKYAPADTPCITYYPTDPHRVDWSWTDNELELVCQFQEVCNPDLDYIIDEATECCSITNESDINSMPDPELCREVRRLSEGDCDVYYSWSTCIDLCRKCIGLYIIRGLGSYSRWMHGYTRIYDPGQPCASGNCAYPGVAQAPAGMLLNRFRTGICRDYATALVTLLRKAGFRQGDVAKFCDGEHCYNIVKLPGDVKYHIVDTTGNHVGIRLGSLPGGYEYCERLNENNYCFDGRRANGDPCDGSETDTRDYYPWECRPGMACIRDNYVAPDWAPTIDMIIGCGG